MKRLTIAAIAAMLAIPIGHLASQARAEGLPQFAVDPFWPKPLPDSWILGQVAGIAVDNDDNVWIVHRPSTLVDDEKGAQKSPPETRCCIAAPPVLQFSADGRLLKSWGGPGAGYEWPESEHGIHIDKEATSGLPATARTTTRSSSSRPTASSCSRLARPVPPAAPTARPSSDARPTW